jgi:MHS family shikimate/dehydroshikimate transporter-like MFS transporter
MSEIAESPQRRTSIIQVALASWIGTSIEWYDFFLYGTASALVFNRIIFPASIDPFAGLLGSYAVFATGFVARPVGSIVFGHYGDRVGRKTMLVLTLIMMGLATFLIGCLPGYDTIGVFAPIVLVVLRFVQGFATGGEWGGAILMSIEHSSAGRRGFFGSWPQMGAPLGTVLSALAFILVTAYFPPDQPAFLAFGWRIPFLVSVILVAVGLFVRLRIAETPEFEEVRRTQNIVRVPILQLLRLDFKNVLLASGIFIGVNACIYIFSTWILTYGTQTLKLPQGIFLNAVLISNIMMFVIVPIAGMLSDRYSRRTISLVGAIWLLVSIFPAFWLIDTRSAPLIALGACVGMFGAGLVYGPLAAYFSEFFGANVRYSGAALGNAFGAIFGGGLAPFIATALVGLAGNSSSWLVVLYLIALLVISLVSIVLTKARSIRVAI